MQSAEPVKETPQATPEVTQPASEPKKESKRPRKKNKRNKPNDTTENAENQDTKSGSKKKSDRPPRPPRVRKHVYVEEENWREKLKETVTLETKIPPKRKKADLMKRPDRTDMSKKLEKKNEQIRKKRKEIEKLFKEKDKIRNEEKKKQNEGYNAFITLKEEKEEIWEKVEAMRKELKFKSLRDKQTKWREKMRVMMDKSPFKGIAKTMEQAQAHINRLKMDFRDKKKTAKEEKAMTDSIRKFEKGLAHFEKVDTLKKKMDANWALLNDARDKLKPLESQLKIARAKLKKNNDEYKRKKAAEAEEKGEEKPDEKDEKEKKEKKERVLTPGEQEIMKKVKKARDDIDKLRKDKDEILDEFDLKMVEYRKDHLQFAKDNYINKLVNDLKYEEKQRKWEEDKAKREEERLQKLKDARKEIFTSELSKIQTVNGALQLLKLDKDRAEMFKEEKVQVPETEEKVDYEAENLELFVSKKKPKPGVFTKKKKHKKKRKERVNLAMLVNKKKESSLVQPDIAVILNEMGVPLPKDLNQVEETIKAVSGKRDEYLKLRERYVNEEVFEGEEADVVKKAEALMNAGRQWNGEEGEEGEIREQKAKKPKGKKPRKKKPVTENEDDFPSL